MSNQQQPLIIFKNDLESFSNEVEKIAWSTIVTSSTNHFANTDLILSGFNKEGKAIQLRVSIGNDFVSDAPARKDSFKRAKEKEEVCRKRLEDDGIEVRQGGFSTSEKPIYGNIY